jgi:integrase
LFIERLPSGKRGTIRPQPQKHSFTPSTLHGVFRIVPEMGAARVTEVRRSDLQSFVDQLVASGLDPSTLQVTLLPLRAIYRRALARCEVAVNPTSGLEVPAVNRGRVKIVAPEQARKLLEALPVGDRALWATALYAGLRRGELMALRWEDLDLAEGVIRVERGWDDKDGAILPKSREGRRTVPIASELRSYLRELRLRRGVEGGFVFGAADSPFRATAVRDRAVKAWEEAELERITLHQARHTFASLMIAAGVNAKALCSYMGHASIQVTYDKYGHLMPGNEAEAAGLLDAYLERVADQTGVSSAG